MPGTLMEEIEDMIDELDDPEAVSLTTWEATFLDDLMKLTADGRLPSMNQVIKLRQIHAERVGQQRPGRD